MRPFTDEHGTNRPWWEIVGPIVFTVAGVAFWWFVIYLIFTALSMAAGSSDPVSFDVR